MQRRRLERGNTDRLVPPAERFDLMGRDTIALVKDEQPRNCVQAEFLENGRDCRNLDFDIGCAGVHNLKQQVRLAQFLQRRTKGSDQFLGKVADKSDSVRNDHLLVLRKPESSTGGIQRFE